MILSLLQIITLDQLLDLEFRTQLVTIQISRIVQGLMKAIVWTKPGPPDVLQLQEVATPTPKVNEVLIRICAATVLTADCELRRSRSPTAFRLFGLMRTGHVILGQELAGEIEAVGNEVTRFRKGDQVFAWAGLRLGAYAEYTCLSEKAVLATKPSTMTYEEAATLPVSGLDAVYLLRKSNIQRGEKALIIGAGGSMGTFAVQLAKHFGAIVTGVDSTGKLDMLSSIGADQVIDYSLEDFADTGERFDVIFDVISKDSFSRSMKLLRPNGRYLLVNPPLSKMVRGRLMSRRSSNKVIPWATRRASQYTDDIAFVKELIEAGKIRSVIDRRYPLEQTAEAHRYVETGLKKGHVVLTLQSH